MTNAIPVVAQILQQTNYINWTLIISVCAVSLTAMTAAINIFKSKKSISDEVLRESNIIQDIFTASRENSQKNENIKEVVANLKIEIEKIKVEMLNTNKSMEELKKDNRELVQRLDELLKQLMELLGN